ncbi:hypothetical protein FPRO05_08965 [Fusarium proliferatum]|uniref:Transcription factor domain-containing protein n=1 Tax=Gibberella intermedia TaxID=948311 RepID=A0A365NFT5_GIBIN|nr:hypothetical protein FPRO05_08965 [Fusarium proliferatum]
MVQVWAALAAVKERRSELTNVDVSQGAVPTSNEGTPEIEFWDIWQGLGLEIPDLAGYIVAVDDGGLCLRMEEEKDRFVVVRNMVALLEAKRSLNIIEGKPMISDKCLAQMICEATLARATDPLDEFQDESVTIINATQNYVCFLQFNVESEYIEDLGLGAKPSQPLMVTATQRFDLTIGTSLHYCYVLIQLYEILTSYESSSQPLLLDEDAIQKPLTHYRVSFETILRIHYLRHSFEYGNIMLTQFLAMLAFLALNKLDSLMTQDSSKPEVSSMDAGDADTRAAKSTLLIAQKGLSDQGRGYYLPKIVLQDVLDRMTPSDSNVLQSFITILREGQEVAE